MNSKMMLLATVSALALGSSAFAADMPVKAMPMSSTWAGCYLGASVGGASVTNAGPFSSTSGEENHTLTDPAAIYGAYAGCNYQRRNFVYGFEADFSGLSGRNSRQVGQFDTDYDLSSHVRWLSTVRGRAGIAVDEALFYFTGGLAIANSKSDVTSIGSPISSVSSTGFGWTVGAGIDYKLTQNWIARGEMLYVDIYDGSQSGLNSSTYSSNLTHQMVIGRVGLAYKW